MTPRTICFLVAALWACHPDRGWSASPEEARRDYDAGHFSDAMGIWQTLSREGDAQAAYGLGMIYDLGNGVPEDPAAALIWYRTAAEAGLPEAEFDTAVMYDAGRGTRRDSRLAAIWYAKAAAHGNPRAQFDLGLLYQQGDGVPRNTAVAKAWFQEAARNGVTAAHDRLAALENSGLGNSAPENPAHPDNGSAFTNVTLTAPQHDTTVAGKGKTALVELVWTAPVEPQPVHYEVIVRQADNQGMHTIMTASFTRTATVLSVPAQSAFYVWSVDTVARDGARVSSDWNWFSVAPAAAPNRTSSLPP